MSFRKIAFLFLLLAAGAGIEIAFNVRNHLDIGPSGCRVLGGRFYGPSYRFEDQTVRTVSAGTRVEVQNAFGFVHVRAGQPGQVTVALAKVVYQPTEERAREFAQQVKVTAEESATTLRIVTNREDVRRGAYDVGFETHLTVEVPPDTAVGVQNEHGEVVIEDVARADADSGFDSLRVERVAGDAVLKSRHGDVVVSAVRGSLKLHSRHGSVEVKDVGGRAEVDSEHGDVTVADTGALTVQVGQGQLRVDRVRGDLEVRGKHAQVTADDVSGDARVATSFSGVTVSKVKGGARLAAEHGEVVARDVAGALTAEASFDRVKLERIGGPVEIEVEHGGVEASALGAGVRAKVSGDSVAISDFEGPADVRVERGSVELSSAKPVTDAFFVSTTHGGIRLDVPTQSRFDLEAEVERGQIEVDLPGLVATETTKRSFKGTMGAGGARVHLRAEGGDVTVGSRAATVSRE
jgi:DUF4097 and DUF4098 domain-containing protein YvlB